MGDMSKPINISPQTARRLAISAQQLHAPPHQPDKENMLALIRQLGCLQIDPLNVVARTPLLVLWSRLGNYNVADFEALMWDDKALFEYWAHAASLVLVEDYPIHQISMLTFARGDNKWAKRTRDWLEINTPFRQYILQELAARGPLYASEIEDRAVIPWTSTGWTNTRNVSTMLGLLWEQGDITVTRRQGVGFGLKKQWGLQEHHMPQWMEHEPLPRREVVRQAAQRSLKALGIGTRKHIENHFIRNRYPGLDEALAELVDNGRFHPITIRENNTAWAGDWYIHSDTLPQLEKLQTEERAPRTTLLSPFDNLICNRIRTEKLFNFSYRSEIYTPKVKRQYGYYVLPILHGDRLIGRLDPKMDRKTKTLHVYAVFAEPDAPVDDSVSEGIGTAVTQLAKFLEADHIVYGSRIPKEWRLGG